MRRALVVVVVLSTSVLALAVPAGAKHEKKKDAASGTVVEGGYVNDLACFPPTGAGVSPGLDEVSGTCGISSLWDGAWTGRTHGSLEFVMDTHGNLSGTYEETLYAVYLPDGSAGTIHFTGTFSVDGPTSVFHAEAVIDGGTCAFAGSTGDFTASGHSLHGGYRAEWTRPAPPASFDPACV